MDIMWNIMIGIHVVAALGIIGLVLLQQGKGADMGAAFGGGSSGSLFGATGSANFLSRTTAILATLFFLTSLGMAYIATHKPRSSGSGGVMEGVAVPKPAVPAPAAGAAPAAPAAPATPGAPSPAAIPGQDPAKGATAPAQSGAPAQPATADASKDGSKANQIPK